MSTDIVESFVGVPVSELRDRLVNEFGMDRDRAEEIKGKANLIAKIQEYTTVDKDFELEDVLESVEPAKEVVIDVPSTESPVPKPTDPEWHDYVMGHFKPDELFKGLPQVDALCRIAELLIGDIIESDCKVIQTPTADYQGATVECKLTILNRATSEITTYREVADCNRSNAEGIFLQNPSATAASKARGRALRVALRLRKILAAEELTDVLPPEDNNESFNPDKKMTKSQFQTFKLICSRVNIDGWKYINSGSKQYTSFNEIPYDVFINDILRHLNKYQGHGPDGQPNAVPEKFKGYSDTLDQYWIN